MHTIISPFPRSHLFLHKNQLGKLFCLPSVCHWMDPKMFGQSGWRSSCQLKQTCDNYFLVSLWKSEGKKRWPFDRWNSNSCQLRLWLKIILLWVRNFFWLNTTLRWNDSTIFCYNCGSLWGTRQGWRGGGASIPVCTLKQTLRAAAFVWGYDCLKAGFFGDEASTEHLPSPVPQRHLPGGIDFGANAARNAAFL